MCIVGFNPQEKQLNYRCTIRLTIIIISIYQYFIISHYLAPNLVIYLLTKQWIDYRCQIRSVWKFIHCFVEDPGKGRRFQLCQAFMASCKFDLTKFTHCCFPSFSIFLSYLIFAVTIHKCCGQHLYVSCIFSISTLNGTCFFFVEKLRGHCLAGRFSCQKLSIIIDNLSTALGRPWGKVGPNCCCSLTWRTPFFITCPLYIFPHSLFSLCFLLPYFILAVHMHKHWG